MTAFKALLKKDFRLLFHSPFVLVLTLLVPVLCSALFLGPGQFLALGQASFRGYFAWMPILMSFVLPGFIFGVMGPESSGGKDLLFSLPLNPFALTLSRILTAYCFWLMSIAISLVFVFSAWHLGPFQIQEILGEVLGLSLWGLVVLSMGVALCVRLENLPLALFLTILFSLLWFWGPSLLVGQGWSTNGLDFLQYFGVESRLLSLRKGLWDSRDLFFFLIFFIFFVFWSNRPVKKRLFSSSIKRFWGYSVIFLLLWNSQVWYGRWDFSSDQGYSVSSATQAILNTLQHPVRITFYRSKRLLEVTAIPRDMEDYLLEYTRLASGNVSFRVADPMETNELNLVESMGLEANPLEIVDTGQTSTTLVYSGLRFQYLDREVIVPLILQSENLEYEITSRILQLVRGSKPKIGLLAPQEAIGFEEQYGALINSLSAKMDLYILDQNEAWPENLSTIICVASRDWGPQILERLEGHLELGGKLFLALEGLKADLDGQSEVQDLSKSDLSLWVKNWGVEVLPQWVFDPYSRPVQYQASGGIQRRPYLPWVQVLLENTQSEHLITHRFSGLDLLWASPLEISGVLSSDIQIKPLIKSSKYSVAISEPSLDLAEAQKQWEGSSDSAENYVLGVTLEGKFPLPLKGVTSLPTRMIVMGDSDFFSHLLEYSQSPYNLEFLTNGLEWLYQDDLLLAIKSRSRGTLPLHPVKDSQEYAVTTFFLNWITLAIVPFFVIVLWGIRRILRTQRSRKGNEEI